MMEGKPSYYEFNIPKQIFDSDEEIQREFLRAYADVAGSARFSNVNRLGKCRVYLDVMNSNWKLPTQLCWLIQDHLEIPVDTITYGHPNLRDPKLHEYKAGRHDAIKSRYSLTIFSKSAST